MQERSADLEANGTGIVVLTVGKQAGGLKWLSEFKLDLSLFCDNERVLFKNCGFHRSALKTFRHQMLWFYAEKVVSGASLPSLVEGDDIFQEGGDVVFNCKTNQILYKHSGNDSLDRISVEDLIKYTNM